MLLRYSNEGCYKTFQIFEIINELNINTMKDYVVLISKSEFDKEIKRILGFKIEKIPKFNIVIVY